MSQKQRNPNKRTTPFAANSNQKQMARKHLFLVSFFFFSSLFLLTSAFKSDELLLQDDDEFGLEGGLPSRTLDPEYVAPPSRPTPLRRRSEPDSPSDSKSVQFSLEHAFGDGDQKFTPAGTFTARLKSSVHGGQTLTKLRFSRNEFTSTEKNEFERLLEDDGFYTIRLPSNVLNPPGRDYVISSIRARCLSQETLDEHFVIHMDGVSILAVNYGSPYSCQYPRLLSYPESWSFNSYSVLKNSDVARRTPTFVEEISTGENAEGEGVKPPEKSFWAKYWMYMIPLGFVVMNVLSQTMNMVPEEQAGGQQSPSGGQQQVTQRATSAAVRRR